MNRTLLNGVILFSAMAGVGTLTSCKDYDSEKLEQQQTNQDFQSKLDFINNRIDDLEKNQDLWNKATELRLKALEDAIKLKADKTDLKDWVLTSTFNDKMKELEELIKKACSCQPGEPGVSEEEVEKIVREMFEIPDGTTPKQEIINWIHQEVKSCVCDLTDINAAITTLENDVDGLKTTSADFERRISLLEAEKGVTRAEAIAIAREEAEKVFDAKIVAIQTMINNISSTLAATNFTVGEHTQQIAALTSQYNQLNTQLGNITLRLTETEQVALQAKALAEKNERAINTLNTVYVPMLEDMVNNKFPQLQDEVNTLKQQYTELSDKYDALDQKIDTEIAKLATKDEVEALANRVAQNEDDIRVLQGQMNTLLGIADRLNSLITGVLVQGVYNPLFGSFSLPIGVQSNMLLNYYGQFDGSQLTFPTTSSVREYNNEPALSDSEWAFINFNGEKVELNNGDYITTGNMGKLFLTINPNNINFTGGQLALEKSNGTDSKLIVENVRRSDEVLEFGVSRAATNNGFYQADVTMPKTSSAINAVKFNVTPGLTTAIKDAVKDRTKSNLFALLRKVYDQLAMGLPAYGLKAGWEVNGESYATYSKYDIAAVAFSPLSYSTLYGQSVDKKLPTRGPLDDVLLDINKDKYHFDLGDVKIEVNTENIKATFHLAEFSKSDFYDEDGKPLVYCNLKGITLVDEDGNKYTVAENEKVFMDDESIDAFVKQLNKQLGEWNGQLESEFKSALNQLADEVNKAVEQGLKDMQGQINDQIDDMIDDIQGSVNDKAGKLIREFNKFLDYYNRAAEKINGWLDNPNHLLQPVMLYNLGNGNIHRMSTKVTDPTVFKLKGGNAVELYATSYTAEILAPAYKKFVAVAGVYDMKGNRLNVTNGNAYNTGDHMAKVLPGSQRRVALPVSAMEPGKVYEIVYSALDYKGYTSTQRFYVTVKK